MNHLFEILSGLSETVIIFNENGKYIKIFTGEDEEQFCDFEGKNICDTLAPDTAGFFLAKIKETIIKGEPVHFEYQIANIAQVSAQDSDQSENTIYYKIKAFPISDINGEKAVAWISRDVSQYKKLELKYNSTSVTDPVTGVYNRRYFFKELNNFFQRFLRGSNLYSLIMLNLDHFEKLSDTFGQEVTENMMNGFVSIIKTTLRNTDLFASTDSEEFIILLPDTPSNGAMQMAERVCESIANHIFEIEGEHFSVTGSFGCSEVSQNDTSYDNVLNRAEIALYQAKHSGGNTVKRLNYESWNK